jgi:hypothetical protein
MKLLKLLPNHTSAELSDMNSSIDARCWRLTHNDRRLQVNDLAADLKRQAIKSGETLVLMYRGLLGGSSGKKMPEDINAAQMDAERTRKRRLLMTDAEKETARKQNAATMAKKRLTVKESQRVASQSTDTAAHVAKHAANARPEQPEDSISEQTFIEWTRTNTENVGKGAPADLYFANYTQDLYKSQLLFHVNSGHDYFPSYERIPHGHPDMAAETWPDTCAASDIDQALLNLHEAIAAEEIKAPFKNVLLSRFKQRFHAEAQLPSCCCCGIRGYPENAEMETPLTVAENPTTNKRTAAGNDSFTVVPINDGLLERLKVTPAQRAAHAATQPYRSVFKYGEEEYHLHPHLVLPATQKPGSMPRVVLCRVCRDALKRPFKPASETQSADASTDRDADALYHCGAPKISIAGGKDFGKLAAFANLPKLNVLEKTMIAKVILFGTLAKAKDGSGKSRSALETHIISFPHTGPEALVNLEESERRNTFPFHSNETLSECFRVSFVGSENGSKERMRPLMLPGGPYYCDMTKCLPWLKVLRQTNPEYAGLQIKQSVRQLQKLIDPLHALLLEKAQVASHPASVYMENCRLGADVAGVRELPNMDSESQHMISTEEGVDKDFNAPSHARDVGDSDSRCVIVTSHSLIVDGSQQARDPDDQNMALLEAVKRACTGHPGPEAGEHCEKKGPEVSKGS